VLTPDTYKVEDGISFALALRKARLPRLRETRFRHRDWTGSCPSSRALHYWGAFDNL